ncbi:MAG: hypothetical protein AAF542_24485 [Pseudomonadota bacterium]
MAFLQEDATYFGIDAELMSRFAEWDDSGMELSLMLDRLDASIDVNRNDHIPLAPPRRYGVGLNAQWGALSTALDFLRVDELTDVVPQELSLMSKMMLARIWIVLLATQMKELFVQGKNLSDDQQRHHVSFTKT